MRLHAAFEQAVAIYERAAPGDARTGCALAADAMRAASALSAHYHRAGDRDLAALWDRRANAWHQRVFASKPPEPCGARGRAGRRRSGARTPPAAPHDSEA